MTAIYELTKFQTENLVRAANGGSIVFAVMKPSEKDSPEKKAKFEGNLAEMMDLVRIGLLEDISPDFTESIKACELNNDGRSIAIVKLTTHAQLMFADAGHRSIN